MPDFSRRRFLGNTALIATTLPLPAWAIAATGRAADGARNLFNLDIAPTPITLSGRSAPAIGINGTVPRSVAALRRRSAGNDQCA